ncbi:MAG TPA: beta-phosphoglucomutase family hydrolase [Acidimicrobiales bacterium]|nr:beta-phosphoglucomutase family hydrolase [Acidimicrobiales bacterium]
MPLGLPDSVRGFLFDMDGVLTRTASVHAAAWKETFDDFLRARDGAAFVPFDAHTEYDLYVDGRTRLDGTRAFLASRGIELPEGSPADRPGRATVEGLSNRKNQLVLEILRRDGVQVFDDAVRYVRAVKAAGYPRAVVSASANTAQVLDAAGIAGLFDARVDGVVAAARRLAGKPAPDMFLAGADLIGVPPAASAVFEDALAGVEAGRAGRFACVVGVDRVGQAGALREHGADLVVSDVASLLGAGGPEVGEGAG